MKIDPTIARALARLPEPDLAAELAPSFAVEMERLAYAAARAARPKAWVEWSFALLAVSALGAAAWWVQRLDPELAAMWATAGAWPHAPWIAQLGAASDSGGAAQALAVVILLWLVSLAPLGLRDAQARSRS